MRAIMALMMGLCAALPGGAALAQPVAGEAPRDGLRTLGAQVTLAGTAQFDVASPGGGFRVRVCGPESPAPSKGYGVIYALDAGWTFGTLCDAVTMASVGPPSDAGATVIVGIGWPTPSLLDMARRGPDLIGQDGHGASAEATLDVLTRQIIAQIETALPIDPAHRMILGHSFGGAFALRAALRRPDLFSHVIAASPSIWTDPDWFLSNSAIGPDLSVTITLGALENPKAAAQAGTDPTRLARLKERAMFGRAIAMATRLKTTPVIFPERAHGGALAPALAMALSTLWQRSP